LLGRQRENVTRSAFKYKLKLMHVGKCAHANHAMYVALGVVGALYGANSVQRKQPCILERRIP